MNVFLVQHAYERDEAEDVKLIGVYGSDEDARAAQSRAALLPGFRDYPDGFSIDRITVGHDCWTGGFVTVPWRDEDAGAAAEKAA